MAGCNCGKKTGMKFEVHFNNGSPMQTYESAALASAALQAAGRPAGSTVRAVRS